MCIRDSIQIKNVSATAGKYTMTVTIGNEKMTKTITVEEAPTYTVTAPGAITDAKGVSGSAVASVTEISATDEEITYTVTLSGTSTDAVTLTFTAGSNSTIKAGNCAVTGSWTASSGTEATLATSTDATGTVTFTVTADSAAAVGAPTIALS